MLRVKLCVYVCIWSGKEVRRNEARNVGSGQSAEGLVC